MTEKVDEAEEVSFIAQTRSGGGTGTSLMVTIPKGYVNFLELKQGDWIKVTVKKLKK
ncbi:MAG: hypothetical protein HWN68_15520 [Desulfobacterales bacterium]|nr:hypothetical protein [Desulfobacterales bacterium]